MTPPPGRAPGGARGSRALRASTTALALVLVLAAVLLLAGGWHFSGEIRTGALEVRTTTAARDLRVIGASPSTVTLEPTAARPDALDDATTYGLDWPGGYGQVSGVVESGPRVTRGLSVLSGSAPVAGQPARLRRDAFPDAGTALRVDVKEVSYTSPAGAFPAWLSPGDGTTWAVLTHGRGAERTEMLRLMRVTSALGLPSLNITYRRDRENGGGLAQFGQDEWADLEAAVQYALDHGARRVVLGGASMGGAITAAFLERSTLAEHVVAVVLDAPMLDLGATIQHGAAQRRLPLVGLPIPAALTWTAQRIAHRRYGLDASRVDYLDDTGWLDVPTLVFHGTSDDTVPVTVTDRLAAAEPGLVEAVVVDGADHVESWNLDPVAYDATVRRFLAPYSG